MLIEVDNNNVITKKDEPFLLHPYKAFLVASGSS